MTPPTMRVFRALNRLPILAAALLLNGCTDEPPSMPGQDDTWRETELPGLALGSSLAAVAFAGDHGYALGASVAKISLARIPSAKAGTDYLLLARDGDGTWVNAQLAAPPGNAVMLDLAAGASGLALGGYLLQGVDPSLIYDERGEAPTAIARAGFGIAAVDGDDTLMLAGGTATGGALWASRTPGHWTFESTPLDPSREGGYTDVFVGRGQALACGFEDGADTLQVVLRLEQGTGAWRKVPLGADTFGLTLRCVAAAADGTLLLGGLSGAGGPEPRAFLRRRDAGGTWSPLALPDGDLIGGINDILPAAGGAWYVVCGGEGGSGLATILRVDGDGIRRELTPFAGSLMQLATDAAGAVHAVGYRLTPGAAIRQALMLVRN